MGIIAIGVRRNISGRDGLVRVSVVEGGSLCHDLGKGSGSSSKQQQAAPASSSSNSNSSSSKQRQRQQKCVRCSARRRGCRWCSSRLQGSGRPPTGCEQGASQEGPFFFLPFFLLSPTRCNAAQRPSTEKESRCVRFLPQISASWVNTARQGIAVTPFRIDKRRDERKG
jgi:hypothetical protein